MGFIDFAALKQAAGIEEAVRLLGLKTTKSGHQLRGPCPACRAGGDRALAITPGKDLYYCFAASGGGDQIQLVAHVKGIPVKEAGELLAAQVNYRSGTETRTDAVRKEHASGFQPLDYLDSDHDAVVAVGFEPEVAKQLGIGYAPKGILRGSVAVPLRLEDGSIAGYIGITEAKLPTKWHLPHHNFVQLPKKTA